MLHDTYICSTKYFLYLIMEPFVPRLFVFLFLLNIFLSRRRGSLKKIVENDDLFIDIHSG